MSPCIIHVRHWKESISYYMGRLRFTLTNILFWIVLILSCLLSENYALFHTNPRDGLGLFPTFFLTFSVIAMLIIYYFLEHKKNGLKFDKVLLPIVIIFGILMIWTIFRQDNRVFTNWDHDGTFEINFSFSERMLAALQVVIWLSILYAVFFVYNRFRLNNESYRWVPKIFLVATLLFSFIDLFYEWDVVVGIFNGTYTGAGVEFIMGNANVFGLLIFSGIISAVILSYKRFSWYYFTAMICLYLYLVLTTSATAIYISTIVVVAYPLYEILSRLKQNKKFALKLLVIYGAIVISLIALIILFVNIGVPMFANFWNFIDNQILHKDFLTVTGRTVIWQHIFDLLKGNALDLIFGLGHQTSSNIYHVYNATSMPVKSAHNAVMEIFLRFGLLGATIYVGVLALVVVCFVIHIKHKRYRFAFMYGLAYLAIMAHSIAESTNIFLPNTGGMYFGLFFILPVINVLQSKKLKELKEDTISNRLDKAPVSKAGLIYGLMGISALALITKIIANIARLDLFLMLVTFMVLASIVFLVLVLTNNKVINDINNNVTRHYIRLLEEEKPYEK